MPRPKHFGALRGRIREAAMMRPSAAPTAQANGQREGRFSFGPLSLRTGVLVLLP